MRKYLRFGVSLGVAILCPMMLGVAGQSEGANTGTIACRVLEAHANVNPPVAVVVFHQQNKADQEQLATLLREYSGESVEIQVGDGKWISATMFLLKSCFGRGMLLLPPEATMKDGATFLMRIVPDDLKHR
jgi:hypothetical protein